MDQEIGIVPPEETHHVRSRKFGVEETVMEQGGLCGLQLGLCDQAICVRMSRLWEFRGGIDHGSVKLLHMVLSDKQGNHVSALVPTHVLGSYIDILKEGLICTLTHYFVAPQQLILNMVDAPMMIVFRQNTVVSPLHISEDGFPKRVYSLTMINELPPPNDTPARFVDIVGVISAVSPIVSYAVPRIFGTIHKRHVLLSDLDGHQIMITLWGEAAQRFDSHSIYSSGQDKTIFVIFVGTTVRRNLDSKQLAGGSACRWYIDEDLPEINALRSSRLDTFNPVVFLPAPHETILQQQNAVPIKNIPLVRLLNFNFFEKKDSQFRCAVRIFKVSHVPHWWVTHCTRCSNLARPDTSSSTLADVYECSRFDCPCTTATLVYRLCLIGRDSTGEAEFIVRGDAAQTIIGLSVQEVVKMNHHGASPIINMHVAASQIRNTPAEFSHVSSTICKFVVNVSTNSFYGRRPSFLVTLVESLEPMPVPSCTALGVTISQE